MKKILIFAAALMLLQSCHSTRKMTEEKVEVVQLDTLVIKDNQQTDIVPDFVEVKLYKSSKRRYNDLLHTKLEIRFDWENEKVIGKATLKLKPYFYPVDKVVLDAKNMTFEDIRFASSNNNLKYDYDNEKLTVYLGRAYSRDENYTIVINYVATPVSTGGSAVITSNKGLYFINAQGKDPFIPQEIWTQGETESNSKWFPTIDSPNERCTEELLVTVDKKFKTLSNGILISSVDNKDSTRTDYWKMDKPHAPYLFMLAVGDFAVVKDDWHGKELSYWVEPAYRSAARAIFSHTPEMLTFFSDKFGVDFPWQKYAQIIVRNFVSGAMENTTAVVFGDYIQKHEGDLVDDLTNEKVVCHEMSHHWFGDYVTTESWANIPLNESFANYSEYLWLEHQYGKYEADMHLMEELNGYLREALSKKRAIVDFYYDNREDVFDAHSYNKGGCILHMLRNYVGDDAFFASLKKYLTDNALSDVEVPELRMAFEDVTGEDLNWFFNQWFYAAGHPVLKVKTDFDPNRQKLLVTVEQQQNPDDNFPVYRLPLKIDLYFGKDRVRKNVVIDDRVEVFEFEAPKKPSLVDFDADKILVGEINYEKSKEEYIFQYYHLDNYPGKYEALSALANVKIKPDAIKNVFVDALDHPFHQMVHLAIDYADKKNPVVMEKIRNLAINFDNAYVRANALYTLGSFGDKTSLDYIANAINNEKSNFVKSTALNVAQKLNLDMAVSMAKNLENSKSPDIIQAIGEIYLAKGDLRNTKFFEEKLNSVDGFLAIDFIKAYSRLVIKSEPSKLLDASKKLEVIAMNMDQSPWRRFPATSSIDKFYQELSLRMSKEKNTEKKAVIQTTMQQIVKIIENIKAKETNPMLQGLYKLFPTKNGE